MDFIRCAACAEAHYALIGCVFVWALSLMQEFSKDIQYPPIDKFSYYRQRYGDIALPATEAAAAREVTLPLYPSMNSEVVDIVLKSVQQALQAATARSKSVSPERGV
jgi:hypothetical protein